MRYFTSGGGRFSHHCLLSDKDMMSIVRAAVAIDAYTSVQSYDLDGVEQWSQLVFDIDSDDMVDAYDIAIKIADDIKYDYDTGNVSIWYSGSKGFHVVTGLVGCGSNANKAMKAIAYNYSREIDPCMYKSRSMFRLPNTINSKSGFRKIQTIEGESLYSIQSRAHTPQPYSLTKIEVIDAFTDIHNDEVARLSSKTYSSSVEVETDWKEALVPCMKHMLIDGVGAGHRFNFCFMLVKHWRMCGVKLDEAIDLSQDYPIFKEAGGGKGYTPSMIKHYYMREEPIAVGCKNSTLSEEMNKHCSVYCMFSEEGADNVARNFANLF